MGQVQLLSWKKRIEGSVSIFWSWRRFSLCKIININYFFYFISPEIEEFCSCFVSSRLFSKKQEMKYCGGANERRFIINPYKKWTFFFSVFFLNIEGYKSLDWVRPINNLLELHQKHGKLFDSIWKVCPTQVLDLDGGYVSNKPIVGSYKDGPRSKCKIMN